MSERTMQNVFIPPVGAMQFEFKPEYAEMYGSQTVWVLATTIMHSNCHGQCFAVLAPSPRIIGAWTGKGPVKVCECRGRIIE